MKPVLNRRAFSSIFASLILLSIVSALFIPIFLWSTGLVSESKNFWDSTSSTATERIVIEMVNLRSDRARCEIYVRNIGKTAVTVENIFIISSDGSTRIFNNRDSVNFKTYIYDKTSAQFLLRNDAHVVQGDLLKVVLNINPALPSSSVYTFKAYTPNGVGDVYQLKG
ncbi:MAG: hypothetical protein ACUVV4_04345 [Candidatus Bathyarchaeia archaeon]